jgi:phospholipid/cholesterol/gamma-HCH transport system substrate-binding protein
MIQANFIHRDLDDRGTLVRRAMVLLVVLALVGAFLLAIGRGVFRNDVAVSADIDDIGGSLTTGADVKLYGVIIGRLTSITPHDGGVRLGLAVNRSESKHVPRNVEARILPASVFGTAFVDLVPPAHPDQGHLVADQVIAQDRSAKTLELQDALDSTYRVMSAVKPAELATTLAAVAGALDGRGAEIGDTVETLNSYLAKVDPQIPLLRKDLRLLASSLTTFADVSPDLLDAVHDSLTTSRTIVDKRAQLTSIIAGGTSLVDEGNRLLTDQEQPFVDTIKQAVVVVDAMHDERTGISLGFRAFVDFANRASKAFSGGPWMNTNVFIKTGDDAPYTAADCPRFGSAAGDNCPGGATGVDVSPTPDPDADAALIATMKSLLGDLDANVAANPGGVGELLSRPYLGGSK